MAPKGTFPHDLKIGQRPESPLLFSGKITTLLPNNFVGSSLSNHLHMIWRLWVMNTKPIWQSKLKVCTQERNPPCIPGTQMTLEFVGKGLVLGGLTYKNRVHWGSRYIYIIIYICRIALVSLVRRVSVTIPVTFVPWDVYMLFSPGHENLCATGKQPFGSRKRVWNVADQRRVHVDAPNFLWEVKVTGNKQLVHLYTNNVALGMFLLAKGFTVEMFVCQKHVCKYCPFPRVKALWMICILQLHVPTKKPSCFLSKVSC